MSEALKALDMIERMYLYADYLMPLTNTIRAALRAALEQPSTAENWKPSGREYDRSIHHNPDAAAWADFFMDTFPNCGADRDTMFAWFANAMMAVADSQPSTAGRPSEEIKQRARDIEDAVMGGDMSAEQVYTQMWQLVDKASCEPSTAEAEARALEKIFTRLFEASQSYERGTNDYAACCVADTLLLQLFPEYKSAQENVRAKRIREGG